MLSETFQVVSIIEKLSPACKDFKNYLKHMRNEMSIEDLIIRLHIEEDNRGSEKKGAHNPSEAKANFVEHGQYYKFKKANNKGKGNKLGPKEEFLSRSFKGNASTVGSKVTNPHIADYQRETNLRKPMWFMESPRMCMTLTSQQ